MKAVPFCRLLPLLLLGPALIAQTTAQGPIEKDAAGAEKYRELSREYEREQSLLRSRIRIAQASAGRARLEAEAAQAEIVELNSRLSRLEAQALAEQAAEQAAISAERRRAEEARSALARAEARRQAQAEAAVMRHYREQAAAARERPGAPPNILRRVLSTGEVMLMINTERLVFPDAASADAAEAKALADAAKQRGSNDVAPGPTLAEGGGERLPTP